MTNLVERLRVQADRSAQDLAPHDAQMGNMIDLTREAALRIEWLQGLFDFSDEEIVSHTAPNDPVTAGSIVLRREHYEEVQAQRRAAIAAITNSTPL